MPYTDKYSAVERQYNETMSVILARLLRSLGWRATAITLDVSTATVGDWVTRSGLRRECVYLLPGERIVIVRDSELEKTA